MRVHADDFWKLLAVIGGCAVFLAAHTDQIPSVLMPYQGKIEIAAYIWTAIQAQRMIPANAVKVDGGR
jgi:hypothetical protein